MKMRRVEDGHQTERLLRDFYAAEIAASENRVPARSVEARATLRPAEGGRPARFDALRAQRGAWGPIAVAAAALAVVAAGAIAPLPARTEVPGLYLMLASFGELADGAGFLEPFNPAGPTRSKDGGEL